MKRRLGSIRSSSAGSNPRTPSRNLMNDLNDAETQRDQNRQLADAQRTIDMLTNELNNMRLQVSAAATPSKQTQQLQQKIRDLEEQLKHERAEKQQTQQRKQQRKRRRVASRRQLFTENSVVGVLTSLRIPTD